METQALTGVNIMDVKVGMIVHFYSARFEIVSTQVYDDNGYTGTGEKVMVAMAKWLDGAVEPGYFGPKKNWQFQGNSRVHLSIEQH